MPKIYTSASKSITASGCWRKWFFLDRLKLPILDKGYRTFGTVLHAVIERYMGGDETGREEDGSYIDYYPEGWESVKDEKTGIISTITEEEQILIKALVEQAIKKGIINRLPNAETEKRVTEDLGSLGNGYYGVFNGFIDILYQEGVEDHKTTKSTRYIKKEEDLKQDLQALLYSYFWFKERDWKEEICKVTFNYFIKEPPPRVTQISVDISREACWDAWQQMIEQAKQMAHISSHVTDVNHLPWPPQSECKKYGGCEFLDICSRKDTIEGYTKKVNAVINNSLRKQEGKEVIHLPERDFNMPFPNFPSTPPSLPPGGANIPFGRPTITGLPVQPARESRMEVPSPSPYGPTSSGIYSSHLTAAEMDGDMVLVPPATTPAPPWAIPGCLACGGSGFATNGAPCNPCDQVAWKTKKLFSGMYNIKRDANDIVWKLKPEFQPAPPPTPTPQAPQPIQYPAPPPPLPPAEPEDPSDDSTDPADSVESVESDVSDLFIRQVGKPSKGFTLCVNCVITKSRLLDSRDKKVVHLDQLIEHLGSKIAAQAQAINFWLLDSFKRRDLLKYALQNAVDDLSSREAIVLSRYGTPEEKEATAVLRVHAKDVVEGIF